MISCVLNFPCSFVSDELAAEIRRATQKKQVENPELFKPGIFFVTVSQGEVGVTVEED